MKSLKSPTIKVGVPVSNLKEKFLIATSEQEAVAIAVGHYLATGKKAKVYMGADGFANCINIITSLVIPYKIPIYWNIQVGRNEEWHRVMTDSLDEIISILNYDTGGNFE